MRRLSLTGPSRLRPEDAAAVVAMLASLGPYDEFTTGAAPGLDTVAADALRDLYPESTHRVVVPAAEYDELGVLRANLAGAEIVWMPGGEDVSPAVAYRARNETLVSYGDELLAVVTSETYHRSGEWMTANIAAKVGVPVTLYRLAERS